jgi:mono/diheme cytochrome c family protein
MPIEFYRNLADDDLAAIIAYLRIQPPVKNTVPRSTCRIPLPPNYGPAVGKVKAPSPRDKLKYGKYLADIGHCMECHTPRNEKGELVLANLGAGGQVIEGPWGKTVSRDLTPTGLKDWSDGQIARRSAKAWTATANRTDRRWPMRSTRTSTTPT